MQRKKAVVAKLKELAKKQEARTFVLASSKPTYNSKVETAKHKCNSCTTDFSVIAGADPFCVTCGSEDVKKLSDQENDSLPEADEELSAVECGSCGRFNILHNEMLAALGEVHCTECGEVAYTATAAEGEEEEEEENKEEEEEASTQKASDDSEEEEKESDEEKEEEKASDDSDSESEEEKEEEKEEEDASKKKTSEKAEEDDSDSESEEEKEEEDPELATKELDSKECDDGEKDEEKASDSEEEEEEKEDDDTEEATLKLVTSAVGDFSLELAGDKLTAYVGNTPVATLEKANAGDNEKYFQSHTFARAIKDTVSKIGAEKALAHYKFDMLEVKVPVAALKQEKIEAKIQERMAEISATQESFIGDFMQSLQIAAMGLNKSFFKKDNPLKSAFYEQLSALGVKAPAKLIDSVFAKSADSYHETLLEIAEELLNKNPEVRQQLAETVGVAGYQVAEMDEDEEEEMSEEASLETSGIRSAVRKPVIARKNQTENAPTSIVTAGVEELRKANRGRLF